MRSCLIVDDSPTVRKVLRAILVGLGFSIAEADNGRQALEACRAAVPDVIFLDWNMPVMDGLAFLRALRSGDLRPQPTVIFCTTVNELPHIEEALDAGADEYLMKPFDEELVRLKLAHTGLL